MKTLTIYILKNEKEIDLHNFQDVFNEDLIQYLIEKFSFKRMEYELIWSTFGWASIFDKTDWEGDRDSHLDKITDAVNKACLREDDDY